MNTATVISDPGIDDLVALLLLHKLAPRSKNNLIATFGNAPETVTSQNAKEFISFVAHSWQFLHGSTVPMSGKVDRPWPDYFHGPDGVWGVHPSVDISSVSVVTTHPNTDDVISLGPMTDALKVAQQTRPRTVTIMGGAFAVPGNETPFAETNISFDPDAAAEFFRICNNMTVRVVPLDVTQKVFWNNQKVEAIPKSNAINTWFRKLLRTWFDNYAPEREKHFTLHDPLAVYLAFYPKHATWQETGVHVVTEGEQRGRTLMSTDPPPVRVALDVDTPREIAEEIYQIIFS